jgi:aryl-alcohol dehydrogenase-like predicted oxidoreductase
VTVIAYSPIAKGTLSGKYTPDHVPSGLLRRKYTRNLLVRIQPLIAVLKDVGQAHDDKTPSQVALNWLICKGAVPIPGAKNLRQVQENFGALGWRLTDEEVAKLDELSKRVMSNE